MSPDTSPPPSAANSVGVLSVTSLPTNYPAASQHYCQLNQQQHQQVMPNQQHQLQRHQVS
jgi:hypothetical protein